MCSDINYIFKLLKLRWSERKYYCASLPCSEIMYIDCELSLVYIFPWASLHPDMAVLTEFPFILICLCFSVVKY